MNFQIFEDLRQGFYNNEIKSALYYLFDRSFVNKLAVGKKQLAKPKWSFDGHYVVIVGHWVAGMILKFTVSYCPLNVFFLCGSPMCPIFLMWFKKY